MCNVLRERVRERELCKKYDIDVKFYEHKSEKVIKQVKLSFCGI